MSAALVLPSQELVERLPRKRFTRADIERMLEAGVFEGERYELIDGDLIDKMGQKPAHAFAIQMLLAAFVRFFDAARIRVQLPIEAGGDDRETSLPEPDLALLAETKPEYQVRHPHGSELLLVVEISLTTTNFDLNRKAAIYAAAGVPEYWVLDLVRRMLVVHRKPDGSVYRLVQLFAEADVVSMEGREETIRVGDVLPQS